MDHASLARDVSWKSGGRLSVVVTPIGPLLNSSGRTSYQSPRLPRMITIPGFVLDKQMRDSRSTLSASISNGIKARALSSWIRFG